MNKNILEKAVITSGKSTITVYGDTARLVNILIAVSALVSFAVWISKEHN